jgi:hypothetical protein
MICYLVYLGDKGQIFTDLLQIPPEKGGIKVTIDESTLLATIGYSDLPSNPEDPVRSIWQGALQIIWPGTHAKDNRSDLTIPADHFVASFWNCPTSRPTVGQLLALLLDKCVDGNDLRRWNRLGLRSVGRPGSIDLGPTILEWIRQRDLRLAARRRQSAKNITKLAGERRTKSSAKLHWPFLDAIVLAHWKALKRQTKRELWVSELVRSMLKISEAEAKLLGASDAIASGNSQHKPPLFQYLSQRGIHHFNPGRPSPKEYDQIHGGREI